MIDTINNTELVEDIYDDDIFEQSKKFTDLIPNQELAYKYMEPIKINGKSKFFNDDGSLVMSTFINKNDEIEPISLLLKEYSSPGKSAEFSICGSKNALAKKYMAMFKSLPEELQ